MITQELPKQDDPIKAEKERILMLLLSNSARMTSEYRMLIKKTGGLLTTSMVYAYSKALNDVIKLLTQNEESK